MTQPFTLRPSGPLWLLVDTETGEVVDAFRDYRIALETLTEQVEPLEGIA